MSIECQHHNIVLVRELEMNNNKYILPEKNFVECEDCKEILPIYRVTCEERVNGKKTYDELYHESTKI
jgi:hypothetical protein